MTEVFGIAAFRSRQSVLRFEDALKRAGLHAQIVSTPREVALGCGLSVRFDMENLRHVKTVLNDAQPTNLIGLYEAQPRGGGRLALRAISR